MAEIKKINKEPIINFLSKSNFTIEEFRLFERKITSNISIKQNIEKKNKKLSIVIEIFQKETTYPPIAIKAIMIDVNMQINPGIVSLMF